MYARYLVFKFVGFQLPRSLWSRKQGIHSDVFVHGIALVCQRSSRVIPQIWWVDFYIDGVQQVNLLWRRKVALSRSRSRRPATQTALKSEEYLLILQSIQVTSQRLQLEPWEVSGFPLTVTLSLSRANVCGGVFFCADSGYGYTTHEEDSASAPLSYGSLSIVHLDRNVAATEELLGRVGGDWHSASRFQTPSAKHPFRTGTSQHSQMLRVWQFLHDCFLDRQGAHCE